MAQTPWHLAQINNGKITGVNIDDPVMRRFVAQLDEVSCLAEKSKGFVWRLKDEHNNATAFNPFGDNRIIINLSVWESIEDLFAFIYQGHAEVLKNRKDWFVNFCTTVCSVLVCSGRAHARHRRIGSAPALSATKRPV